MKRTEKKERRVWLPILAATVIWVMAFVGCGKDETTDNTYNTYYNYSSAFDNATTVFTNTSTVFTNVTTFVNITTTFTNNTTTTASTNSITVASPNGGETLTRGGNMSTSWSLTSDQSYSLFFYMVPQGTITISGTTYYDLNAGGYSMGVYSPTVIETSGSWTITIPTDIDASVPYKLRMYVNKAGSGGIFNSSDVLVSDDSDAEFTVN